jgi:hypothetical protein
MDNLISKALKKQIRKWQWYSIVAPIGFLAASSIIYFTYNTPFNFLFYTAVFIFAVTCVVWWHWCLITMGTMLQIMNATDEHFDAVSRELELLRKEIKDSRKKTFNLFDN